MKVKIQNNKKIIIMVLSMVIFLLVLKDVYYYEITSYDNWAYKVFVEDFRSNNMTIIMKFFTFLGSGLFIVSSLTLMILFFKNKRDSLLAILNVVIVFLLNNILKIIVQRPRPSGFNLITESNYSFPSGHSMISTAFYGFFMYLIYKNVKNNKLKYTLMSLLFLLIVLICISRIYLGVHYLSDTLAGFFISLSYLMIFISLIPKLTRRMKNAKEKEKVKN